MRTNDKRIIKRIQPFDTHMECYADDLWFIPLQPKTAEEPDISDDNQIDNHGYPYILISHSDDLLPEKDGHKNMWKVETRQQLDHDDMLTCKIGDFKTAHDAVNNAGISQIFANCKGMSAYVNFLNNI